VTDERSILALEALAERALEVLVTHNEAVSCDDLACALGVSSVHAWEIANTLKSRGYAIVDDSNRTAAVSDVMTAGKQAPRFRIVTQPMSSLAEYGSVPIRFTVTSVLDVQPIENGLGGWRLIEHPLAMPYEKDYDQPEPPTRWTRHGDLANWTMLAAYTEEGEERIGGAVVVHRTPGVHMLEGREDLAVLWDIRVKPGVRGHGIGHQLFEAAATTARQWQCRLLKIETQNINVAACRFYAREGCQLRGIHPGAYADFPDEIQLLWYLEL
jgi:GNAT superfamily N-acetyltransferase/biotin operon repressor